MHASEPHCESGPALHSRSGFLRELLGDADLKTTLRYIDVNEDGKRGAIAAVFGCRVAARGGQEHASERRDS